MAAHGMVMGHREPRSHTVGLATATGMAGRTDPQAVMAMAGKTPQAAQDRVGKTHQAAQETVGMVVARAYALALARGTWDLAMTLARAWDLATALAMV